MDFLSETGGGQGTPPADEGRPAIDVLDARVDFRYGSAKAAVLFLPLLIGGLVRYAMLWGRPEISRPCSVVVFRRADAAVLVRYDHRFAAEAFDQLAHVLERLHTETVELYVQSLDGPTS